MNQKLATVLGLAAAFAPPPLPPRPPTDNSHNWRHNLETEIAQLEMQQRDKYAEKRLARLKVKLAELPQ